MKTESIGSYVFQVIILHSKLGYCEFTVFTLAWSHSTVTFAQSKLLSISIEFPV